VKENGKDKDRDEKEDDNPEKYGKKDKKIKE
jgi:hypothetical protein